MVTQGIEKRKTGQTPTVGRVISVLSFFIEHSQQVFTLTQVASSLRLSRATIQPILLSLVQASYLYRRPDKSYMLGRALHLLAAGVNQPFSALDVASQEMRLLADELDVIASALFIEGDELVVRERAASVTHLGWTNFSSTRRYPLQPWGRVFMIPLTDAQIVARLDEATPPLSEEAKQIALTGVGFARRHGFMAVLVPEDERPGADRPRPSGRYLSEFVPDAEYPLRSIVAPVMGASGEVAFGITLYGFLEKMTGEAIMAAGGRLCRACERISSFMTGKRFDLERPPAQIATRR